MIRYLLGAALLVVAVTEDAETYRHTTVGQTCAVNDVCQGNSQCQHDGSGGFACLCSPCQYYDSVNGLCVDNTPGYCHQCHDKCSSNFVCVDDGQGGASCQCPPDHIYDHKTDSCVANIFCVNDQQNGCQGLANGDYPACFPECQKGVYITCSNGYIYKRDCALGWYVRPNGVRFTEKLVYNPSVKWCERKAQHCPRPLDALVEQ